jgi:hypothetical protein
MSGKATGWAWDQDLPQNLKFVLLAYADKADHEGKDIFPSVALISKMTGLDRRTVQRATKQLVGDELLIPDGLGPKATNRYRLPMDGGGVLPPRGAAQEAQGGGAPAARGAAPLPPDPSFNDSERQSDTAQESAVSRAAADECRREAQAAFEEYTDLHPPTQATERQRRATGEMWWAPLREICEESRWDKQAARALIAETVDRMSRERLTISSPKSIVAVARSVVAEIKRGAFMPGGAKANPQASVAAWLQRTT